MNMKYVRADLRRILLTVPNLPAVYWEMRHFKPSAGVPYIREQLDPVSSATQTLGALGKTEDRYLYRLDVYWPSDGFVTEGEDMADAIRIAFPHGREIVGLNPTNRMSGTVLSTQRRPLVEGDVFNQFPVDITFYIRRPTRLVA